MNIRPALISAPLPWLTMLAARVFGRKQQTHPGARRLFRLPRSLKFTREGKGFSIVLMLIGIVAINTGNNLLYLVVAMLLSLIIISGIMSNSTLKKLGASPPGRGPTPPLPLTAGLACTAVTPHTHRTNRRSHRLRGATNVSREMMMMMMMMMVMVIVTMVMVMMIMMIVMVMMMIVMVRIMMVRRRTSIPDDEN